MKKEEEDRDAGVTLSESSLKFHSHILKKTFTSTLSIAFIYFLIGNLFLPSLLFHRRNKKTKFTETSVWILGFIIPCPRLQTYTILFAFVFALAPIYPLPTVVYRHLTLKPEMFRRAIGLVRRSNILTCLCVSLPWVYLAVLPLDEEVYLSGVFTTVAVFGALIAAFKVVGATESDCLALETAVVAQSVGDALLVLYRGDGRLEFFAYAGFALIPIPLAIYFLRLPTCDFTIDSNKGVNLCAEASRINRTLAVWIVGWTLFFMICVRFCNIIDPLIVRFETWATAPQLECYPT